MAVTKGKGKKQIVVELGDAQPKKHVTRYDAPDDDDVNSIYINKTAIEALGNPAKIKLTIEAA